MVNLLTTKMMIGFGCKEYVLILIVMQTLNERNRNELGSNRR